jgi:hypothetical protein
MLGDLHLIKTSEVIGMAYRKRVFLNPISLSAPSFVQAVADSSDEGTYLLGNYVLIIGDCRRSVMLEFSLSNAHQRTISRKKIDKLFQVISEFREAVYAEAALIDKQET